MSPDFEIIDPRFGRYLLGNCKVERLYTGTLWAEGVTHGPDGPRHIRAFDVEGARLRNGRVFAISKWGLFDGLRLDTEGNVWTIAGEGVNCYSAKGELLGRIRIPETVSNCTFGGPKRNRLFMTATSSLYAVFLNARGVQTP